MSAVLNVLQKPKFREPCNRCGECCRQEACEASVQLLQSEQIPCIALEVEGNQFRCGLVHRPHFYFGLAWSADDCRQFDEHLGPLVAKYIGTGQGCGMPDEELLEARLSGTEKGEK